MCRIPLSCPYVQGQGHCARSKVESGQISPCFSLNSLITCDNSMKLYKHICTTTRQCVTYHYHVFVTKQRSRSLLEVKFNILQLFLSKRCLGHLCRSDIILVLSMFIYESCKRLRFLDHNRLLLCYTGMLTKSILCSPGTYPI